MRKNDGALWMAAPKNNNKNKKIGEKDSRTNPLRQDIYI